MVSNSEHSILKDDPAFSIESIPMAATAKQTRSNVFLLPFAVTILTLTACGKTAQVNSTFAVLAPSAPGIQIDGSSTVYPTTDLVAKEFRKTPEGSKATIEVKFSGTSGGFKKFCKGEIDIADASRPINTEELAACDKAGVRYVELPVAFDALTIVVNPQNDWAKDLTIAELKTMWEPAAQGKIKTWNQVRASFPNRPLNLFGPGQDSGSFEYFNEVTSAQKLSRTDYKGSEDDNDTVKGVENDPNALGYFGFSYYEANPQRLKAVAIDSGKGSIEPSRKAVEKATYQPFSRPLLVYVNYKSAQDKPEVKSFVDFYLKNAKKLVTSVGSIPLPDTGYRLAEFQFNRGMVGTVFEGRPQPNLTMAYLLRKQKVFQLSKNETTKK
jgi:phosphate transport system substrate-binding protein